MSSGTVPMTMNEAMSSLPLVSVVFTVYNEEENLDELYRQVVAVIPQERVRYELVFVDNGSSDTSLDIIRSLRDRDPQVKFLSLSRNFGHQGGLFAGMCYATGQAVITMDADLQHPPSLIPEMLRQWELGYDVVYTTKDSYEASTFRKFQIKLFYKLLSSFSGLKLSFGQSDFRLLSRRVLDVVLGMPEQPKFLRGMVEWVGFRQIGLNYDVAPRFSGVSKFSYRSLLSFALDGIISFSSQPLHWIFLIGLVVAGLSFVYTLFSLLCGIMYWLGMGVALPPGWATLAMAITGLGGLNLIALGIIGEYIRRIFNLCKGRPTFIVQDSSNLDHPVSGR
jgi:dolichol-phosphate mannosyltransferase